jgi:hypothetical protein
MHGLEALPRLPQSDTGNLQRLLRIQTDDRFGFGGFNTGWAKEEQAPVLAARICPFPGHPQARQFPAA